MNSTVYFYALLAGIINSAVGSGGGLIFVPLMKKIGLNQKNAHATTLAVILPLTILSAIIYAINGDYSPVDALKYIPLGVAGSFFGVKITRKIKNTFLKKIFAAFMIWAGIRMVSG